LIPAPQVTNGVSLSESSPEPWEPQSVIPLKLWTIYKYLIVKLVEDLTATH